MLAEEMAQTTPSIWEVESAFHRVVRKLAETAKNATVTNVPIDWQAKVAELVSEYGPQLQPIVTSQITEFLESSDDEFYLKEMSGTESFESFESAVAELEKFAQKMQRNHENRVKEGRILSTSNRAKVQAAYDALGALLTDSEPKPKPKEMDVEALRTQAMRLNGQVMATLSR